MRRPPRIARLLNSEYPDLKTSSISRRDFIRQGSGLFLAGSALAFASQCKKPGPRIAILGAGLAGLTAAYHLENAGQTTTIYEALDRIGGRVMSATNLVADGITTEMGGEFIDSTHSDIFGFCKKFNLSLLDMKASSETKLVGTDYFFKGRRITEKEIIQEFAHYADRIKKDNASLPDKLSAQHPKVVEFDRISIDEYLYKIGINGWLFDILSTSFTSELGIPAGEQPSLNLIGVINADTSKGFEVYGDSDERFKIAGGNEQLAKKLRDSLQSTVKVGHHLTRISSNGEGYKLSFENGVEEKADFLIVTLPFSVLRDVEIDVKMPERKRRCIEQLGYGTQSKLFIGVRNRLWRAEGFSGYVLSDQVHNGWDSSQMQKGNSGPGGYSLFLGADKGMNLDISQYDSYLNACDQVYPGMKENANGRKNVYNWNRNPMTKGAYACYHTGQVTSIGGAEKEPVGNMLFAGEHCSEGFQGYMNGAAETGRKAAEEIIKKLGIHTLRT